MKKISDILSGIPSFSGLSEKQIEELQEIVVNRHFNRALKSMPSGHGQSSTALPVEQ